jgi:hypothetical protein
MKRIVPLTLVILAFAGSGLVHGRPLRERVPNISGTWFMNGDENLRCKIIQRRLDGHALFINENGSPAPGTVRRDEVWIPEWTDGRREGLVGRIRGDKIVWPNGSFWSR